MMVGDPHGVSVSVSGSRRRFAILAICCMSLFIVGLDNTIVNVALPSIGRQLHGSLSDLQWTVDAYTVVLASLLMLAGSTADRVGRRRTFQTGLVVFSAGSLLCSLAPSVGLLIGFRAVQALGGTMLNPVAMSIITNTFTERKERAQAIGIWGGVVGLSMALGPVLGGALVSSVGWRSIFWINVPIGVAGCTLAALYIPESRSSRSRSFDPVGQVLLIAVFASLTFGIIEGARLGWSSPLILTTFGLCAAALVAFVTYESRRKDPLLELRFFRSIPFSGATIIAVVAFTALGGFLFVNTLYLQQSRGLSPLQAGLATLPMAVMTVLLAPLSGAVVGRRGARIPLLVAGSFITASGLMLTRLELTTPFVWLFASYVLFGIGFGVVNPPITNAAVSGMPNAQAGVAAAIASTSRQVGQTLGVAALGALATAGLNGSLASSLPAASHAGWWVIAGCGLTILVLGLITTSRQALASAHRAAASFDDEMLEARGAAPTASSPARRTRRDGSRHQEAGSRSEPSTSRSGRRAMPVGPYLFRPDRPLVAGCLPSKGSGVGGALEVVGVTHYGLGVPEG
jgi:EmrB/QacA subfamily drug resistance transporter